MSTTITTSYRRTKRGEWVVFGPAHIVRPGVVQVSTKAGLVKEELVEKVGKAFTADGLECRYGYIAKEKDTAVRGTTRYGAREECEECGVFVKAGSRCWETGLIH